MRKLLSILLLILFIGTVSSLTIRVTPKIDNNYLPDTLFDYTIDLTTNADCTGVIATNTTEVKTDHAGIAYITIDTSSLTSIPQYLCEYRDGILRSTIQFESIIFNSIYANNLNISGTFQANNITAEDSLIVGTDTAHDPTIYFMSAGTDGSLRYEDTGDTFHLNHGLYIEGTNGFLDVATRGLFGEYVSIDEYLTVGGFANISGVLNVSSDSYFGGDLIPFPSLTHDIGSGVFRWGDLYVSDISADDISVYDISAHDIDATGNITGPFGDFTDLFAGGINISNISNLYLNLSGGNANQNIDIGVYNFTAPAITTQYIHMDGSFLSLGMNPANPRLNITSAGNIYGMGPWDNDDSITASSSMVVRNSRALPYPFTIINETGIFIHDGTVAENLMINLNNDGNYVGIGNATADYFFGSWNGSSDYTLLSVLNNGTYSAVDTDTFVANYSTFLTHATWGEIGNGTMATTVYVDEQNTSMGNYVDSQDIIFNDSINNYIVDVNTTQSTWVDNLFVRFTEIVSQVGNWSADKVNYYTSTQVDAINTSMKNYADGTFVDVTGDNMTGVLNTTAGINLNNNATISRAGVGTKIFISETGNLITQFGT